MAGMSRAIRLEAEKHAPSLAELPLEVLRDFEQIVGAYYMDLRAERERRESASEGL
jgi:hypothetical protein